MVTIGNNNVYLNVIKRVGIKSSLQKKKNYNYEWRWLLTRLIVVIML